MAPQGSQPQTFTFLLPKAGGAQHVFFSSPKLGFAAFYPYIEGIFCMFFFFGGGEISGGFKSTSTIRIYWNVGMFGSKTAKKTRWQMELFIATSKTCLIIFCLTGILH